MNFIINFYMAGKAGGHGEKYLSPVFMMYAPREYLHRRGFGGLESPCESRIRMGEEIRNPVVQACAAYLILL